MPCEKLLLPNAVVKPWQLTAVAWLQLLPVHDSATSTNGETVSGRKGTLNSPYSGTPNTGIRSSALSSAMRLPNNRSRAGHEEVVVALVRDATHSSGVKEPYP